MNTVTTSEMPALWPVNGESSGSYPFDTVVEEHCRRLNLPSELIKNYKVLWNPMAAWVSVCSDRGKEANQNSGPMVFGICGNHGCGKTTLAYFLEVILEKNFNKRAITLSLDDYTKSYDEREKLSREIFPLMMTPGVPGTHNTYELKENILHLKEMRDGDKLLLPRFDKKSDQRMPETFWHKAEGHYDIIFLEGWCVGARAQKGAELLNTINSLERDEDPNGRWRRYVNGQLAGPYQKLFDELEHLIHLSTDDKYALCNWRLESLGEDLYSEEEVLEAKRKARHFLMHFERISLQKPEEIFQQEKVVLALDGHRQVQSVTLKEAEFIEKPPRLTLVSRFFQ